MPQAERSANRRPALLLFLIPILVLLALLVTVRLLLAADSQDASAPPALFQKGLLPAAEADADGTLRWGYIDTDGNTVIPFTLEAADSFAACGLAAVRSEGLWGYIDRRGSLVIPLQFEEAQRFSDGRDLAPVRQNGRWGYIDRKGETVIACRFLAAAPFDHSGLAAVRTEAGCGFINGRGELVIEPIYDEVNSFDGNGHAVVSLGGAWGLIDTAGDLVLAPRYEAVTPFAENGLALVKLQGKYGFVDRKGREVIPPTLDRAEPFSPCGLALAQSEGKYGYIDKKGAWVIPAVFTEARSFGDNDLAAVRDEATALWGFLDTDGRCAIKPAFESAENFSRVFAAVREQEGYLAYIRADGSLFMRFAADCLSLGPFFDDDYAVVTLADEGGRLRYRILGRNGRLSDRSFDRLVWDTPKNSMKFFAGSLDNSIQIGYNKSVDDRMPCRKVR